MRKLILQMQTSVDMYVGAVNGDASWMNWSWGDDWTWDAKLRQYHIDTTASADCVLVSDRMAQEGFIDHWAAMAQRSDNPQSAFAENITRAYKVIFSHDKPDVHWPNARAAVGDMISAVNTLKKAPGKNLIAFGGAGFARSLIAADLVDEFHFIVNPVVLGKGVPILTGSRDKMKLELMSSEAYSGGMVVLRYARNRV